MADITDIVEKIIREEIDPTVKESLPEVDPIYTKTVNSSIGVTRDGIGRDWYVKHAYRAGLAGAYQFMSPNGGTTYALGQVRNLGVGTAALGTTQGASPGYFQRVIKLAAAKGNMFIPVHLMQMNQLSAMLADAVADIVKGTAENIAHTDAAIFYATRAKNSGGTLQYVCDNSLGTIAYNASTTAVRSSVNGTNDCLTITLGTGSIRNFRPGQAIEIYELATGGTPVKVLYGTGALVVTSVDYLGGTSVVAMTTDASAIDVSGLSTSDQLTIVPAGSVVADTTTLTASFVTLAPFNPDNWISDGGTLGPTTILQTAGDTSTGLNLSTYPQFKSIRAALSAYLNETSLNYQLGRFFNAYGGQAQVDLALITQGILLGMLEFVNVAGTGHQNASGAPLLNYDRQGQVANIKHGWNSVTYTYQGKNVEFMVTPYQKAGRATFMRSIGGNLKRYTPPRIAGAGSAGQFDGEIQFLVPLGGGKGIFKLMHDSSGNTLDMVEAPFYRFTQVAPEDPRGMILDSVTEANGALT